MFLSEVDILEVSSQLLSVYQRGFLGSVQGVSVAVGRRAEDLPGRCWLRPSSPLEGSNWVDGDQIMTQCICASFVRMNVARKISPVKEMRLLIVRQSWSEVERPHFELETKWAIPNWALVLL